MIDTIALTIPQDKYKIVDDSRFSPSTKGLFQPPYYTLGGRGNFSCYQNPTTEQLRQGNYLPRLTVTKRVVKGGGFLISLRIEFSAPKLLFGNNFDEATEANFEKVVDILWEKLSFMGVLINKLVLEQAPVSAVHYSKNIPLLDGSTPYHYIRKMRQANISFWIDVNQTDFRNDGYSYKWHCNAYEVSFYDKIHDLQMARKSDKRAIEDNNLVQLNLFDNLEKRKQFEVLRMEVRINSRQKMKSLFQSLNIETDLTFKSLFNQKISQSALLHYLNLLDRQRPALLDYKADDPRELLTGLVINNPDMKQKQLLCLYGLKVALDNVTPRELRVIFSKFSSISWYRLVSEAKKIHLPAIISPFRVIRECLVRFDPLKLVDFQDRMINNDKYTNL